MPLENTNVTLFDSSDTETGTSGNPLRIDPTGTTTQPVSGTVTANQGTAAAVASAWPILVTDGTDTAQVVTSSAAAAGVNGLVVYIGDDVNVTFSRPSTCTVSSVALSTTNATVLASNTSRLAFSLWNDGAQSAYVKFGATATTADFTVRLSNKGFYDWQLGSYTGIIDAITATGTATMLATECT